jgi:hypothetical protein
MDGLSWTLILAAAGIALTHAALGPDHYLPFIMLGRVRRWSVARATAVTAACGVAHLLASLMLAAGGLVLGVAAGRLEAVESARGNLAAWAVVAFGLAYAVWGGRKALRKVRGLEPHQHAGLVHVHERGDRPHAHAHPDGGSRITFWTLFGIFVLGPCEPLIPLFMLPASRGRWGLAAWTAFVFGLVTVLTMVGLTLFGLRGLSRFRWQPLETWGHTLAGGIIAASGLLVLFLGL